MMLCFGFFVSSFCVSFFSLSFFSSVVAKNSFLFVVNNEKEISSSLQTKRSRLFLVFCGGNVSFIPYKLDIISHEHHHVCTHYPICWRPSRLQDECAEEIGQQSRFGEF